MVRPDELPDPDLDPPEDLILELEKRKSCIESIVISYLDPIYPKVGFQKSHLDTILLLNSIFSRSGESILDP